MHEPLFQRIHLTENKSFKKITGKSPHKFRRHHYEKDLILA